MKFAICDDERIYVEETEKFLKNYMDEFNLEYTIDIFKSGVKLLKSKENYDCIFLDIDMPILSGMDVASELRKTNSKVLIVFITSYNKYVYDAFKVNAFRFLVKPITKTSMSLVLDEILIEYDRLLGNTIVVCITKKRFIKLFIDEIIYIETLKRRVIIHTTRGVYDSDERMKNLSLILTKKNFYRAYTSYLVNISYVVEVGKTFVKLNNGKEIPVSRLKQAELQKGFSEYLKKDVSWLK